MPSLIPGYEYDIFISYRQKDNKYDGWVTEFVDNLKKELEATFKEEISVYFDINPHDGLLETHDVDASLKEKLKCLIFIPIISRTYCDPKSFAWEHEFKAFVKLASEDQFGLKIKLPNGNVASRVLPVQTYDLNTQDRSLFEKELAGYLRPVEFIYQEPGVNRPLKPDDDEKININKSKYRNQVNKVANAVDGIINSMKTISSTELREDTPTDELLGTNTIKDSTSDVKRSVSSGKKILLTSITGTLIIISIVILWPKIFKKDTFRDIRDPDGRISVAVMPFKNITGDTLLNIWQDGLQTRLISNLSNTSELSVRSAETMLDILGNTGRSNYASITPAAENDIAVKLEAGTYIIGSLSKAGRNFGFSVHLKKAGSSEIYKSFSLDFTGEDNFLIMADSISFKVRDFLLFERLSQESPFEMNMPINTNSPEAYLNFIHASKLIFNSNNWRDSFSYLNKALEIDSNFTSCYYFIGMAYLHTGDRMKAEAAFKRADKFRDRLSFRDQQFFDHWKYAYLDKNPQKGLQILYQLAEQEPQNRLLLNQIGDLNRLLQNYDMEIEAYENYIEVDEKWGTITKWIWPYVELGDAFHIKGNHKREAFLYDEALKMRPDQPDIIYRQARCALTLGDTSDAKVLITKLLSIYKDLNNYTLPQLKSVEGNLYSDAGIPDKAERCFREALAMSPASQYRLMDLARFLIDKGLNIEEGLELIDKALAVNPDSYNFQYIKGLGLLKQGKYSEALVLLENSWNLRTGYNHEHFLALQEVRKAVAGVK